MRDVAFELLHRVLDVIGGSLDVVRRRGAHVVNGLPCMHHLQTGRIRWPVIKKRIEYAMFPGNGETAIL